MRGLAEGAIWNNDGNELLSVLVVDGGGVTRLLNFRKQTPLVWTLVKDE